MDVEGNFLNICCLADKDHQEAVAGASFPLPAHLLESSVSFGIPDDFKELVRDRTNLVDLVSERVELQALRNGQDYVGLCPFHDDKNPSLHVYPDRGSYRCWSCQEGGDCFSWVQELERLNFPEAIEYLAERLNLEVPRQSGRPQQPNDQRKQLYSALAWAETEMHDFLMQAGEAARVREYLNDRGYGEEVIRGFRIGYHPADLDWFSKRSGSRFNDAQLIRAGLRVPGKHGGSHDHMLFKDRLIFSIRDRQGRPIAFGGRVLPGGDDRFGKYQNSSDNDFFHKSQVLYGFDVAAQAIRQAKTAFVVEGYTDCISCHQHGLDNTVAILGTAFTPKHVAEIKRFGERIVLACDGDEAGQKSAEKAIGLVLGQEVDLRVITFPNGQDPAEFLEQSGVDAFRTLAEEAPEAIDFKFVRSLARHGTDTVRARERVRDEVLELLASCPNLVGTDRLDIILGKVAQRLVTDEWRIRNRLSELQQNAMRFQRNIPEQSPQPERVAKPPKAESDVLEILLIQPDQLDPIRAEIGGDDFTSDRLRALFERILDLNEEGTFDGSLSVMNSLDDRLDLKKLTVALGDAGCDKNIESLLNADVVEGQYSYVESVLNAIKLRRTERQTEMSKHTLSSATGELDSDTLDALRRLQQAQLERMRHPRTLK